MRSPSLPAILALALLLSPLGAQDKRALTHHDYDGWQSLRSQVITDDGGWVAYVTTVQVGDAELVVRQTRGDTVYRYPRGNNPTFSPDGRYVVFRVEPEHAAVLGENAWFDRFHSPTGSGTISDE